MSVKVDIEDLAATIDGYGFAYLVTVGDTGRAHVLAVLPEVSGESLVVGGVGRHSQENVAARPAVTLVWPPTQPGGFSLLVDGAAAVDGATIRVAPTKAILHRPATAPDGTRAGSDCAPI